MGYTIVALKDKIMSMYPEIQLHHISTGLDFDEEKNAYVVHFRKGRHQLQTYLEKGDADECMNDVKCVHLGVKIAEFVKNFESAS